jgi:hypothetical protein
MHVVNPRTRNSKMAAKQGMLTIMIHVSKNTFININKNILVTSLGIITRSRVSQSMHAFKSIRIMDCSFDWEDKLKLLFLWIC